MFSTQEIERYSRHILLKGVGTKGQKILSDSKVLIIGAGGLGSPSALYLAAAGIGTIGIADGDQVDLSNLQRQILHKTQAVGQLKTVSAKETIAEINPHVKVEIHPLFVSPENIAELIAPYDFVIEGVDNFPAKFLINDACVLAKKPFSHGGILQFSGQLMTYIPGKGPCYRCIFEEMPPENEIPSCSEAGVLGVMGGVIGSLQGLEALKYLLQIGELLTSQMLIFDGLSMSFRKIFYKSVNSECKVCGNEPVITDVAKSIELYRYAGCKI
ncbi:adenylyltransferase [Clostridia bacterium]|nr:adenylyltransferase [Clostridia bacterium]